MSGTMIHESFIWEVFKFSVSYPESFIYEVFKTGVS
jgi:hypothetical protein